MENVIFFIKLLNFQILPESVWNTLPGLGYQAQNEFTPDNL